MISEMMMWSVLDNAIHRAIDDLETPRVVTPFDLSAYIAAFKSSAQEKAKDVLTRLNDGQFPARGRPVFVSVGGGDGEELAYLLKRSRANCGVLIEMQPDLARVARARALDAGKTLEVIERPAQEGIVAGINAALRAIVNGRADFVAVTCHAVIHELYDRGGTTFDPKHFFSSIFRDPEVPTWFTYREPGAPEYWTPEVILAADCDPSSLLRLANVLRARHESFREDAPEPVQESAGVRMHRDLAMEVLAKLFYLGDLRHEIEERSTSVHHRELVKYLWDAIGEDARLESRGLIYPSSSPTRSFVMKWQQLGVQLLAVSAAGVREPVAVPESQTRIVAWRVPIRMAKIAKLLPIPGSMDLIVVPDERVLFYSVDWELLDISAREFSKVVADRVQDMAHSDLRLLLLAAPPEGYVVLPPTYYCESEICRDALFAHVEAVEQGVIRLITEYTDLREYDARKRERYLKASHFSHYRDAYFSPKYPSLDTLPFERTTKQGSIGRRALSLWSDALESSFTDLSVSRDQLAELKTRVNETEAPAFLWENVAEHMQKVGLNPLGHGGQQVRALKNRCYLTAYAMNDVAVPTKSRLVTDDVTPSCASPEYNLQGWRRFLELTGLLGQVLSMPVRQLLSIKRRPEVSLVIADIRQRLRERESSDRMLLVLTEHRMLDPFVEAFRKT
jgi:hypothetical protein